ncbi:hypothetical protein AB3S75_017374 [Citrus x aurantiifolia]
MYTIPYALNNEWYGAWKFARAGAWGHSCRLPGVGAAGAAVSGSDDVPPAVGAAGAAVSDSDDFPKRASLLSCSCSCTRSLCLSFSAIINPLNLLWKSGRKSSMNEIVLKQKTSEILKVSSNLRLGMKGAKSLPAMEICLSSFVSMLYQ